MAMGKGYRVFHKIPPDPETPYSVLMDSKSIDDSLMFESGAVVVLSQDEVEPLRKQYVKVVDAYGCLGALCINFGNMKLQYLAMVTSCLSVGKIGDSEVFRISAVQLVPLRNEPSDEERVSEIRKLLSSGTFYFTWSATGQPWDLSLCAQRNLQEHDTDNRFFWNRMLHVHFQRYGVDCSNWLLKVMCGGIEIRTIYAGHRQAKACLISRLSCERAGTRFNVRGVNDDGNVANFVETEQVIFLEHQVASFIQTRGSVPLFWEQPGIQVGSHKVHMSRGYEMSAPAFDRHFRTIRQQYGDQVIINLLGSREGEKMLSQAFMNHHAASSHKQDIAFYHFDYHAEIKGSNLKNLEKLKHRIMKHLQQFDFFYAEGDNVTHQQTGTLRTNCLDCLDRTNATQTMIGLEMLGKQLDALGLSSKPQMVGRFQEVYKQIWVHNGDHISRIYTGTGALGGGRSKYSDASRSATRTIQNNFLDGSKQEAIDILLMGSSLSGALADRARALLTSRYLHASDNILRAMTARQSEYTQTQQFRICVGTYNVNGGKHYRSIAYKHQSLADWLLDAHKTHPNILVADVDYEKPVDVFAVGFEEIVDLNASNIMSASTTNAREWQKEVLKTISRDHKYVMVTHIQLVGVVLYVFVRPHLAPFIRDVAVEKVKTGLGGTTGNKGGVAIRFLINSTSVCFVCAHLAAGQSQVNDRNSDYNEITRRMAFPMGRTILSHDYVFWCGDFNYRIDLSGDEVKSLVASENWGALQEMDQLNAQRAQGNAFKGFNEGKTDFAPTYKYDTFSDDFDTSDKARTPAWTDRVLWRVKKDSPDADEAELERKVKLLLYTRAELRTSDHRPVVSLFDIETVVVQEDQKNAVLNDVVSQQGPPDGTVIVSVAEEGGELSDEAVNEIVEKFSEVGDIIIVRFVGTDMWVLYQHGQYALEALQFDQQQFAGTTVNVHLKTTEWRTEIERELSLCCSNTGPMYNQFCNDLLGDDFSIPSMEFDIGEEVDEDDAEVESVLSVPRDASPAGRRSPLVSPASEIPGGPPAPGRPPGATPSPQPSSSPSDPWGQPVVREALQPMRASPAPEAKQPPARPSAPPSRPPPPQRPAGGPPRPAPSAAPSSGPGGPSKPQPMNISAPTSSAPPPKLRQPLRPPPSEKVKIKKSSHKISEIGLPTNVTHHGHATSVEEAQALIEKLMSPTSENENDMALPPPLAPSKSETNLALASDQLMPKVVPRSKTATDVNEDPASQPAAQPRPVPRMRSSDNIVPSGTGGQMDSQASTGDAPVPVARPRPVPRKDVQSVIGVPGSNTGDLSGPPPARPRPGSVQVFPSQLDSSFPKPATRPAPPPPASRPAPPPTATKPGSPNSDPVVPSRPSRPSRANASPTEGMKSPDPFDTSRYTKPAVPASQGASILDRENSVIDTTDPFNTNFAHSSSLPLQTGVSGAFHDPFDTSPFQNKVNLVTDSLGEESTSDPTEPESVYSEPTEVSDPFDTSYVPSTSAQSTDLSQNAVSDLGLYAEVDQDPGTSAPFQPPDLSPPPLPNQPPDMTPPKLPSSEPAEEPPPPPPRPQVTDSSAPHAPPKVPSRPNNVPPPVPKRPS